MKFRAANSPPKNLRNMSRNDRRAGRASEIMCDGEITAGLSVSLSGRFRIQGQQALNGLLLWQSWVNAHGGIPLGATSRRCVRLIWCMTIATWPAALSIMYAG